MKTSLYLLTLAILASTFSHAAHAENLIVSNKLDSSTLVVISENGKIKSNTCLLPRQYIVISGYQPSHPYQVITLPVEGYCGGHTTVLSTNFIMPNNDMKANVTDDEIVIESK